MIYLPGSLAAWGSDAFAGTLGAEIRALAPSDLPLHRLASTGYALDSPLSITLIAAGESPGSITARLGCLFEEILPGCSCGDEAEPRPTYGELMLQIDRVTAQAEFIPVEEGVA